MNRAGLTLLRMRTCSLGRGGAAVEQESTPFHSVCQEASIQRMLQLDRRSLFGGPALLGDMQRQRCVHRWQMAASWVRGYTSISDF